MLWEEAGVSNEPGEITAEQWEIFQLAFVGAGSLAILSDQEDTRWCCLSHIMSNHTTPGCQAKWCGSNPDPTW